MTKKRSRRSDEANLAIASLASSSKPTLQDDFFDSDTEEEEVEEEGTRFGSLHPGGGAVSAGGTPVSTK